jgi:hypothetical protein
MENLAKGNGSAIVKLGKAHVALVLDASPSIDDYHLTDAAVRGVNDQLAALRATTSTAAGVTLLQFSGDVRPVYEDVDLGRVKMLKREEYRPIEGSGTALYDGVHAAIDKVDGRLGEAETALVVIITDGEENSSRRNDPDQLAQRITKKTLTGRWTFVLLGPKRSVRATAARIGIPAGNVREFDTTPAALGAGFDETRRSIGRYMDARDRGVASTDGFYLPPKGE